MHVKMTLQQRCLKGLQLTGSGFSFGESLIKFTI